MELYGVYIICYLDGLMVANDRRIANRNTKNDFLDRKGKR